MGQAVGGHGRHVRILRDSRPRYRSVLFDSARWDDFPFRPGDIVISTPPKCGTTWMQMICALLIFQDRPLDKPLTTLSPWLDILLQEKTKVFAQLAAQPHRRFIKTHTPLDGLPADERVTYICVGRDPRDAAISMLNHRANMHFEVFARILQEVAGREGIDLPALPDAPPPPETLETLFWQWIDDPSPVTGCISSLFSTLYHFEVALRARDHANVVVMHYGDLMADREGEMRRLAASLGIEIPEENWAGLVEAASFDHMRDRAAELAPNSDQNIWKETRQFFHSGTGGHWRAFWDPAAQRRYAARVAALITPEVAQWSHRGWLRGERRNVGA